MTFDNKDVELDALVVGAGFAGIYQLYSLRNLGYSVRAIDKAGGVGGTWYWNRYPGAMSDTESYVYRFTWDREDIKTYPWANRYLHGPEILEYLEHVVERHDLLKDIQLNTELVKADWNEDQGRWRVVTSAGVISARYIVTALGLLSNAKLPNIPGLSDFAGQICHSSRWDAGYDLHGKRVGVIGNGSTGVQIITALAPQVKTLVSFQRSPQYSVPSGNRPMTTQERQDINGRYDEIMESLPKTATCFGFTECSRPFASVSPEQQQEIFQDLWDHGNGFHFMYGGFSDIGTDKQANDATCNFIRSKIAEIVKNPEKARKLMPREPYARRPLCDSGYYEQFNRPNVDIVNVRDTPIDHISANGVHTADGNVYELDTLVLATGFDPVEGSYNQIDITGRNGEKLSDHWVRGPTSYLGCFVPGFPNLLTISGPQSPFANAPPNIECQVNLHTQLIQRADKLRSVSSNVVIEALPTAEAGWGEHCNDIAQATLFPSIPSWIFANPPGGAKQIPRFYLNGVANFHGVLDRVKKAGYDGFAAPFGSGTHNAVYDTPSRDDSVTRVDKECLKSSEDKVSVQV